MGGLVNGAPGELVALPPRGDVFEEQDEVGRRGVELRRGSTGGVRMFEGRRARRR